MASVVDDAKAKGEQAKYSTPRRRELVLKGNPSAIGGGLLA
jgi:hypothetical protein